jgi:hypothetical protein
MERHVAQWKHRAGLLAQGCGSAEQSRCARMTLPIRSDPGESFQTLDYQRLALVLMLETETLLYQSICPLVAMNVSSIAELGQCIAQPIWNLSLPECRHGRFQMRERAGNIALRQSDARRNH